MREDYLWDKTGSDPAIERMENALRAFNYEESAQPVMPITVAPPKRTWAFRFMPVAFAVAACLAIAVISWSVWRRASDTINDQAAGPAPAIVTPTAPRKPEPPYSDDRDTPVISRRGQPVLIAKQSKVIKRRTVRRTIPAEIRPKFTKEEIYAYDQLMLALSITSDKLNLVREKAVGEKN